MFKAIISDSNVKNSLKKIKKIKKMKKVKFKSKLSLNKETITELNDKQMNNINGGGFPTFHGGCTMTCTATQICCSITIDTFN